MTELMTLHERIWRALVHKPYSFKENHISRQVKYLEENTQGNLAILEVGIGDRYYHSELEKLGDITTLDPFKKNEPDILADICNSSLPDNSYELVSLYYVLEHLKTPHKAVLEVNRILKNDGFVAGIVPQYWHSHGYPEDYWRFTRSGVETLLGDNGFDIKEIWPIGGKYLVMFHAIELNLSLGKSLNPFKLVAYNLLSVVFDGLDYLDGKHNNKDALGWAFVAQKRIK